MTERINHWILRKGIKIKSSGLQTEKRHNIFVLNSLINNRLKKKGRRLYAAFVDFRAAFDKVDRNILLNTLWEKGITEKMHRIISGIYKKTRIEIISSKGITEEFETNVGCPLSPVLSNIFSDGIDAEWGKNEGGMMIV